MSLETMIQLISLRGMKWYCDKIDRKKGTEMFESADKSIQMEEFLEQVFGRTSSLKEGKCASCGVEATYFRDELSRREYSISALCQECQDSVFDSPGEESSSEW